MLQEIWNDMFLLGLPVLEKILRPLIVYLFLVAGLRLAGKRELASLNPLDLVVLLTISNTVQNAIIGNDNSVIGGLIGATSLLIINFFVLRFLFRHPKVSRILEGEPETLVENGSVKWDVLRKELITPHELEIAANKQGFISLDHVEKAEIEPDGAIFFEEKDPTPDQIRYKEIIERLGQIQRELSQLQNSLSGNS